MSMLHFQPNSIHAIRAANRQARRDDTGDPLSNLELLSAACQLAPQLYRLRGEAFNVPNVWQLLNGKERQFYIDIAIEALRETQP
jgi:hypothetical protein